MKPKKPLLKLSNLEKIAPWGRRCRCGAAMQVYASEARWALIEKDTWRQIVSESGHDDSLASQALQTFDCDWYGCHHLHYRCLVCECRAFGDDPFTEEEALEFAASQNAAHELPDFVMPAEIPRGVPTSQ